MSKNRKKKSKGCGSRSNEYEILENFISFDSFKERVNNELALKNSKRNNPKNLSKRKLHWIYLIDNNKLICPATKLVVSHCSYDYKKTTNSYQYNFRSSDNQLFTIDHKIPLSQGGKDISENIQPMIAEHNWAKQNQMIYCE